MAYTPPAGNAVTFTWVGAAPYSPPAGGSLVFSFDPTKFTAAGFSSTSFGAATVVFRAGSTSTTTFGTGVARYGLPATAVSPTTTFGLAREKRLFPQQPTDVATLFGTGRAQFPQTAAVTSLGVITQIPTPVGRQIWTAAAIAPTTVMPTPSRLFNQEVYPMSAPSTVFGVPGVAIGGGSATSAVLYAVSSGEFGEFGAPYIGALTAIASGTLTTQFGTGRAALGLPASSLAGATAFGSASHRLSQGAAGATSTAFGSPATVRASQATGFAVGAFGSHVGRRPFSGTGTGFLTGSTGTPSAAAARAAARSIAAGTGFGTPQVARSLVC